MRFLVLPKAAARARPPVRIFLAFAALALVALAAQRVLAGGLSPAEVEAHYLGAGGGEALPAAALWEEIHAGAFVYGFVLFMLGSLAALCPVSARVRGALVAASFAATLADLFAPFAIVGLGRGGALRVATFVLAMASMAALLGVVALSFGRGAAHAHAGHEDLRAQARPDEAGPERAGGMAERGLPSAKREGSRALPHHHV
jgi:hypothetical protein